MENKNETIINAPAPELGVNDAGTRVPKYAAVLGGGLSLGLIGLGIASIVSDDAPDEEVYDNAEALSPEEAAEANAQMGFTWQPPKEEFHPPLVAEENAETTENPETEPPVADTDTAQHPMVNPETPIITVALFDNAPLATTVSDQMSFADAFAQARQEHGGGGGVFEWHGQYYNTYTAEEWNAMTAEQHDQFADSLDHLPEPNHFQPLPTHIVEQHHDAVALGVSAGTHPYDPNLPIAELVTVEPAHPELIGTNPTAPISAVEYQEHSAPPPATDMHIPENAQPQDANGDGVNDVFVVGDGDVIHSVYIDENHNHIAEALIQDTNHDNTPDVFFADPDEDGIIDETGILEAMPADDTDFEAVPATYIEQGEIPDSDYYEEDASTIMIDEPNPFIADDFDNQSDMTEWA